MLGLAGLALNGIKFGDQIEHLLALSTRSLLGCRLARLVKLGPGMSPAARMALHVKNQCCIHFMVVGLQTTLKIAEKVAGADPATTVLIVEVNQTSGFRRFG